MHITFEANDESDTDRFGAAVAAVLPPGLVVALVGTLGAGKTRFVQAVAQAVGFDPRDVVSPTFVLVHEYRIPRPLHSEPAGLAVQKKGGAWISVIYHIDAYRIRDKDEFRDLGPEEFFESDGWTFVEWADRIADCLPSDCLQITIEVTSATQRRFTVTSTGELSQAAIQALLSR
jgi:tRNA threonylcarbamoyladenosine biosynthesis protein TsaE